LRVETKRGVYEATSGDVIDRCDDTCKQTILVVVVRILLNGSERAMYGLFE
jgi:hypothetical protein